MQKDTILLISFLSFIVIWGLGINFLKSARINHADTEKREIFLGGTAVYADIADTPAERTLGLSGRSELKDDEGMLFIFETPQAPAFWMKETKFPIDIVWIDENGLVISVSAGISPDSYPQKFAPPRPIKYVLEVPAGFSEKYHLGPGQEMKFGD